MNLFYSNIYKEFELYKNEIEKKLDDKKSEKKDLSERNTVSYKFNEISEKYNSLDNTLKESIREDHKAHSKLVSSLDKTNHNLNLIKNQLEEKIDEIFKISDSQQINVEGLLSKLQTIENNEKNFKKNLLKIEKIIDSKYQDTINLINNKLSEVSTMFIKNSDLDLIFGNQSFKVGIGHIVSQLENQYNDINNNFNRMIEYDDIFLKYNSELKKIKESHNLMIDNYEKRFSSIESNLEVFGLKDKVSQIKQSEDLSGKKECNEKSIKEEKNEKNSNQKEKNIEVRLTQVEECVKVFEKTVKSIQNLGELNLNSLNLKFNEIELKIKKEFHEYQKTSQLEKKEINDKLNITSCKIDNLDKSIKNITKDIEANKEFEIKLLEDYKNLYELQNNQDLIIAELNFEINEVLLLNTKKLKSKPSNLNDYNKFNIKNIILIIESYSLRRYDQLKYQISYLFKEGIKLKELILNHINSKVLELEDFNEKVLNNFKLINSKILSIESYLNEMSSGLNINTIKMKKFIQWEILDVNVKINKAEKELENLSNVIMVFI